MKKFLFILLFFSLVFASSARSAGTEYIGIIPFYAPEKIWKLYTPLIDYLNKTTDITWALKIYHNHEETIDAVCKGEISVAFLGPVPFSRAQKTCGVRPLLTALDSEGKTTYRSVLITGDFVVMSLRDLKGKDFGFFEGSTAADVLPRKMLEDEGITIDMINPVFFKGQDQIMEALMKREIAAAGVKETLYRKFKGERLKVLKISEPVPNFVFCASPLLRSKTEKQFVKALLKVKPLSRPSYRKIVQEWDDEIRNGFVRPSGNYAEEALRVLDLFQKHNK